MVGLFINSLDEVLTIDNPTPYEIRKGVSAGNGGMIVRTGNAVSTATVIGDCFSINLVNHLVKFKPKPLKKGIYWLNVTPQCLNGRYCGSARYFEASEDDDPHPLNHVGPRNILYGSFWDSTTFGENWVNTNNGTSGGQLRMFSAGVLGK